MTLAAITRYPTPLPLPFSKAVRAGGFLFLSGQIPMTDDGQPLHGDIRAQTVNVLDRISATLAELGSGLHAVTRVTVWLADLSQFAEFNEAYRPYFSQGLPARSTVQAVLAHQVGIEIEVTAFVGDDA
ncbi:MAG: RidA family protein [Pseudomonadota bacterium]